MKHSGSIEICNTPLRYLAEFKYQYVPISIISNTVIWREYNQSESLSS